VAATLLDCPQIRIANLVKEMEQEDLDSGYKYAYAHEDGIALE
jgi:hypothetical protein